MNNPTPPLYPETMVPRLGDILIEKGVLSPEGLEMALARQKQLRTEGKQIFIGEMLVELGLIDRLTLDNVIIEQILKLHTALQETNQQLEQRVEERTAELQKALKKLSELNQLKSNIIANVSHELRTPLTHMKGYIELLASKTLGEVNSQQENALQVLQRSTERLERLIEEMIQFSMAARGEFSLRLAPVEIGKLVQQVVGRSKTKAEEHKIKLTSQFAPNLPAVQADEEKISWVLSQLLDNAIKFTPEGGSVTVIVEPEQEFIKVAVKDTGIGIPADRIDEIFESFHQLDGSSTRRYGGTGLGLALVRQIIEAHGSVIRVYSQVGEGAAFEFLLAPARKSQ